MRKNINAKDRLFRLAIAILLLAGAYWQMSWWLLAGSLFVFFEAAMSWCVLYQLIGKSSCPLPIRTRLGPDPDSIYPIPNYDKLVFLKKFVKAHNIIVGDYTYFADHLHGPKGFEERNVLYNNDLDKVKLVIGKFCALAAETKFLMTGDHKLDAISTYPFPIFQQGWENVFDVYNLPLKGDIIVGNDVWFGYDCLIRGGVTIGDGAIIATRAVVVKDVPPYSIVAGNPAKVVKMRFDDKTIERLLRIRWWDWPIEKIHRHLSLICNLDIDKLEAAE